MTNDANESMLVGHSIRVFVDRHLASCVTALALVVVHFRVLIEAGLDREVARQILRSTASATVLGDLLLNFLPPFAVGIASAALALLLRERRVNNESRSGAVTALAVVFVVASLVVPATLLVFLVVAVAVVIRRGRPVTPEPKTQRQNLVSFIAVIGLVIIILTQGMWLPREQLTSSSGVVVGYVLERDGEELVVLKRSDRTILRIAADDISGRTLCRASGQVLWINLSTAQLLAGGAHPELPTC